MTDSGATPGVEAIAIVGMAGRFPKAANLDEFWARLDAGEEMVTFFSDAELEEAGLPSELVRNPAYVKARAVLDGAELFDAAFFGINPREAELMDPQQRVFLECAWAALEHAGYDPDRYPGAIGVYAGLSMGSYLLNNLARSAKVVSSISGHEMMITNDKDFLATRASYKLNLRGPSVDVQAACSTSLVAVQLACQSLLGYQCDMALAGGVSVGSPRVGGYLYQPGMIMSPDGHCRAFDANGRGIVGGEGVGLVVLKRLSEALADHDTIHAIVRGSAINNDGAQKVGFTAPSVTGQAEVIALAQAVAGIGPEAITYIEAHGTGTELGDPIEIAALTQAFRAGTDRRGYCALGSVKTNIGHLDAAAGVAGLIKTVLALKQRRLPPSLNFETPNPNIDFDASPFYVNTRSRPWAAAEPRRAGVSSFGIGGTNAHVVLEEAAPVVSGPSTRPSQLLVLSGRSPSVVDQATSNLALHLRNHPTTDIADVAFTLQNGRRAFGHRRIVVVDGAPHQAAATLETRDPRRMFDGATEARDRPTAFLFTGQGSQHVNMTREVYAAEPVFRSEVDRCAEALRPHLGLDVREVLYPNSGCEASAAARLAQTELAQPALFVVEYALARLWMAWGVQPAAMLGHSIGEYVAACLAGVFSLDDALALVATRGRLMQSMPPGSMLAVALSEADACAELGPDLGLAAVNAPGMCVVSGVPEAVQGLQDRLQARGIECRALHTSHAFHSPMMQPILGSFAEVVGSLRRSAPRLPFVSNLTGTWITADQATSPAYWAEHLRSTVRFADGAATLFATVDDLQPLELGPGQALSSLLRQHPARPAGLVPLAALRHPHDPTPDHQWLMQSLGRLWLGGARIDWAAVHGDELRSRVALPTYPFERQRYWVEPDAAPAMLAAPTNQAPARRDDVASWFYQPSWRRLDLVAGAASPPAAGVARNWLIFADGDGLGDRLIERLGACGQRAVRVEVGAGFHRDGAERYQLAPDDAAGYRALIASLQADDRTPDRIIHLWNVGQSSAVDGTLETQARAFYSPLYLAQALGDLGGSAECRVDLLATGVCDVLGDEPLVPLRALVLGASRVIPQEQPNQSWRCVDLVLPADGPDERATALVWSELWASDDARLIAHRGAHRWVSAFEPVALENAQPGSPALRERGVYLITGGLGGVGLALAEFLARSVRARLVLTGRSDVPEPAYWNAWVAEHGDDHPVSRWIATLRSLQELGAEVLVIRADVTDARAMQSVVERARTAFGAIHGVIHAAGVAGGGIVALKTRQMADQVLAPKVQGTLNLEAALGGEPLDFLAVCSSVTSIVGGAGQIDYCAANAFLAAFAHARQRTGRRTIAIDWAAWQEVGMAVNTQVPAHLQRAKEHNLRNGMRTSEATQAFVRMLNTALPEIVVSPQELGDLLRLAASTDGREDPSARPTTAAADGGGGAYARPEVATAFVAPSGEVETEIAQAWRALLGLREVGVHDNFFDLGGHSLLATRLIARCQQAFGVELPLRSIFETPTIAGLARRIEAVLWASENSASSASGLLVSSGDREEIEL